MSALGGPASGGESFDAGDRLFNFRSKLPADLASALPFTTLPFFVVSNEQLEASDWIHACPSKGVLSGIGGTLVVRRFAVEQQLTHVARLMPLCASRAGVVFGGVVGSVTGAFNFDNTRLPGETLGMMLKRGAKHSAANAWRLGKTFGMIGAAYSTIECYVQKYRGAHTLSNASLAGCLTGGVLAARAGPFAASLGCVGFAAFSTAIDYFMDH